MNSVFRKDLHFLRAFAVLIVVLFHLKIPLFKYGYLGVDIFFFISGYLISLIVHSKLSNKSFSLREFYIKRVLRIVPAYLLIILISIISFIFVFSEYHFDKLKESVNYSLFFVSNIYFFFNSNYFDIGAYFKPLLHLWSLSTEFYFYLFYPLFYLILFKYLNSKKILVIRIIYILNLVFLLMLNLNDNFSFYFPILRTFEFLFGCLVFLHLKESFKISIDKYILLLFFIFSVLLFDYDLSLKIITILILVIIIHKNYIPSIFYNNRIINFIGDISYSLYLVHWPIIVLFNYLILRDFLIFEKLYLFLFSVFLSFIFYNCIEKKFNNLKKYKLKIFIIILFFFIIVIINNFSSSQNEPNNSITKSLTNSLSEINIIDKSCNLSIDVKNENNLIDLDELNKCLIDFPSILIFGDSHANDIFQALSFKLNNVSIFNFSQPGCRLSDNEKIHKKNECKFDFIINFISNNSQKINKVIYTQKGTDLFLNKDSLPIDKKKMDNLKKNIVVISNKISKNKILIFGPQKEFKVDPHQFVGIHSNGKIINQKYFEEYKDLYELDKFLEKTFEIDMGILYFSKIRELQSSNDNFFIVNNKFLYRNKDHWSAFGQRYYGNKINELYILE